MKFASYVEAGRSGLAVQDKSGRLLGLTEGANGYPGPLKVLLAAGGDALATAGRLLAGRGGEVDPAAVTFLPPVPDPGKVLCIGLNYREHARESGIEPPEFPTVFARYASSLVGHGQPILRPALSQQLDYEAELAVIIGATVHGIDEAEALAAVAGYSAFNDGSLRDYQHRTTQWTLGKNFDSTGAFGPVLVTADELPAGAAGLRIWTRLNGNLLQDGTTDDLIFGVARLVSDLSAVMTLQPGDVIITGTPSGVGAARKPPVFMKSGDVCEVGIDGIGVLSNPIADAATAGTGGA